MKLVNERCKSKNFDIIWYHGYDYMSDNGIYTTEVLEEICRRAGMEQEWKFADGETFERVVQVAAQELCPELCRA